MKKRILLAAVLQLFMVLGSCSSDSGNDSTPTPEPPVVVIKTPKVTSYSKNSGESGETISIYGENFSDKVSDIKIAFDGATATIVSASASEIKFVLPQSEKVLPKIVITISDKAVVSEVKNDYEGNIGILPIPSKTGWFTIENTLKPDLNISRVRMLSDKILYCSYNNYVYRTLDGGITWKRWAYNSGNTGDFYPTKKGDGLCYTNLNTLVENANGVLMIPVEGDVYSSKVLWKEPGGAYPGISSVYIDENIQNGTIVSQKGAIYTNSNGGNFVLAFDAQAENVGTNKTIRIFKGAQIDNDHIYTGGLMEEGTSRYPFVLYKNNTTDGWKQHVLKDELGNYVNEISFADAANGFLLIRNASNGNIYKTTNGGDTWTKVYTGENFTNFTFKDGNTGWAILESKIYKTTDGGTTWTIDYTHDKAIRAIGYKDNVVWAISTDKIIKRYL